MESWRYYLEIFDQAAKTTNFAPMLAVLFIGTRMRALQIDPKAGPGSGVPQPWAQTCFYVTAYAVLGQTILTVTATASSVSRFKWSSVRFLLDVVGTFRKRKSLRWSFKRAEEYVIVFAGPYGPASV